MRGNLWVLFLTGFSIFCTKIAIAQQAGESRISIHARDVYNHSKSDRVFKNELRYKFWYEGAYVNCYSAKYEEPGWHLNKYFLVRYHTETLTSAAGYLPTSKKIGMEVWEEDGGGDCDFNSKDDQHCGIIERTLDFSNYEPGKYYDKEISYCQGSYKVRYRINYSSPVPQSPFIQIKEDNSFVDYQSEQMGYRCSENEIRLSTQTFIHSKFHYKTDIVWEYHINGEIERIWEENPNFCADQPQCSQGGFDLPNCCYEEPYIMKEFPKWRILKQTKGNENTISFFPKDLEGISGLTKNSQIVFRAKTIINGIQTYSSLSNELFISPAAPAFTVNTTTQSCRDNATGTIDITVNGVTHDYRYFLLLPNDISYATEPFTQSNLSIENIHTGTYTLKISNNNSTPQANHGVCSTEKSVTIKNYDPVNFTISSDPACPDINNGKISVEVSGGKPGNPFSFSIAPANGNFVADPVKSNKGKFINLPTANYRITASEQCNTTISNPITVKKQKEIKANVISVYPTCTNPTNASLKVTVNNGPGKYNYYLYENGKAVKTQLNTSATTWNITSGLTIGKKYYIEIKDADYPICKIYTSQEIKFEGADLTLSLISKSDIRCPDDPITGEIRLAATGGSGKYTFSVEKGSFKQTNNTGIFAELPAGIYIASVKNQNSACSDKYSISNVNIAPSTEINIAMEQKNIQCIGDDDGSLMATVSGGKGGFTYQWEKRNSDLHAWKNYSGRGNTTPEITGLFPAQYRLSVTDKNGCTKLSETYTISQPSKMLDIEEVTFTHVRCKGANDGSIKITATGGWESYIYLYSINNGITYIPFTAATPLPAGSYQLKVQDKEGCTAEYWEEITLTEPSIPLSSTYTLSQKGDYNVSCNDGNDGMITVTVEGGNGTPFDEKYWFAIDESDFTNVPVFDSLTFGNHNIQVKDERGCIVENEVKLSVPDPISLSRIEKNYIRCFGDASGYLEIEAKGGIQPYQYKINTGGWQFTGHFENLPAGSHEIAVLDDYGCMATFTETINTNPLLTISFLKTDVRCFEENNGQVKAIVEGGEGPYNYFWQGRNESGDSLQNLSPGIYSLLVTDAEGCSTQKSIEIYQPDTSLMALAIPANVRCFGEDNGSITVQATGGTSPYLFSIDEGTTFKPDSIFQPLVPGNYRVLVQDSRGCEDISSTAIHQPAVLSIRMAEKKNILCHGDSTGYIKMEGQGGNVPYAFSLDGIHFQSSNEFHHLSAGEYSVFIRDIRGCEDSVAVTLIQPDSPLGLTYSVVQAQCKGSATGAIYTAITGGTPTYMYSWPESNTDSQHLENVRAGSYKLVVTDANGCNLKDFITISEPEIPLQLSLTDQTDVSCHGLSDGSFSVEASGGYPPYLYAFEDGSYSNKIAFNNLTEGRYTVAVKDTMGCIFSLLVTIEEPSPLAASFSAIHHVSCYSKSDAAFEVAMEGGTSPYLYSVDSGATFQSSPIFSELPIGDYHVWVKDAHQCQTTANITITQPSLLTANINKVRDAACGQANGSAEIIATGGTLPYTYAWINKEGALIATVAYPVNLYAGIYEITITDAQDCQVQLMQIINDEDGPSSQITTTKDASCFDMADGSASVQATGGTGQYQYLWSDTLSQTSPTANNLYRGSYFVTVTDARQCISISQVEIGSPPKIEYQKVNFANPTCYENCDGIIEMEATGGIAPYTYLWATSVTNKSNKAENLCQGIYPLTITDAIGCTYTSEFLLQPPAPLTLEVAEVQSPTCYQGEDGKIIIQPQGGTPPYQYTWDDPFAQTTAEASHLKADVYQILVTDKQKCHAQAIVQLEETPPLPVNLPSAVTLCKDQSVVLDAGIVGAHYQWSKDGLLFSDQQRVEAVEGGTYQLWVQDTKGCTALEETIITAYDTLFEANFLHISELAVGDTLLLTEVCFPKPDSVHWFFSPLATILNTSPTAPQITFPEAGTYEIRLTGYYSVCTDEVTKTVTFVLPEAIEEKSGRYAPTASGIASVEVYPNPTSGSFTVKVTLYQAHRLMGMLYHINGQEITRVQGKGNSAYSFDFNIGGYPAGAYTLHLLTEDDRKIIRVLLE